MQQAAFTRCSLCDCMQEPASVEMQRRPAALGGLLAAHTVQDVDGVAQVLVQRSD